jgi:hypothetical protein
MADHRIKVRRDGSRYEVVVIPPHPAHPVAQYSDRKTAFGAAGGLRMVTGWPRFDHTGE